MNKRLKKKLFGATVRNARSLAYHIGATFRPVLPLPAEDVAIDVAIPCVSKDFDILPLCLEGIRKNITNKIINIYIITPDTESFDKALIARFPEIVIIDEREVMGFGAKDLRRYLPEQKFHRAGWIYQQLIKLSGRVGTEENVLFIDSDHILLKPHVFIDKNKRTVFYRSEEAYYPYYENIKRLTGQFPVSRFSYVAHKMLFNKKQLHQIRKRLGGEEAGESRFPKWIETICASLDWNLTDMPFSEFELYGNLFPRSCKKCVLWRQKTLSGNDDEIKFANLVEMYGKRYLSVTYPAYLKKHPYPEISSRGAEGLL